MNLNVLLTIVVSVTLALIGYIFTYFNNLRLARRKDKLDRIDRQLRDFYGPLFALDQASNIMFVAFTKQWKPSRPRTEEDNTRFRLWVAEVFMPLNLQIVKIITEHADLLEEEKMPDILLALCAHVYGYKLIMKSWELGDYTQLSPGIAFPSKLREYAVEHYQYLKMEQTKLLGKTKYKKKKDDNN